MDKTPLDILTTHGPLASVKRFLSRIDINERGCWLWGGTLDKDGYGIFYTNESRNRAHRLAYLWAFGSVPPLLDHIECDTPRCANPFHVTPATQRANILRGTGPTAENARKTHCPHGHEYTDANTYRTPKNGERKCKECRRVERRKRYVPRVESPEHRSERCRKAAMARIAKARFVVAPLRERESIVPKEELKTVTEPRTSREKQWR